MSTFTAMADAWIRARQPATAHGQELQSFLPECNAEPTVALNGIPAHDPAEWRESLTRWLESACVRSPRCFGGVGRLHIAFCEWEVGRGSVPCTRNDFEWLLAELGFLLGEVSGVVLVSGLTFREDFEAYQ